MEVKSDDQGGLSFCRHCCVHCQGNYVNKYPDIVETILLGGEHRYPHYIDKKLLKLRPSQNITKYKYLLAFKFSSNK